MALGRVSPAHAQAKINQAMNKGAQMHQLGVTLTDSCARFERILDQLEQAADRSVISDKDLERLLEEQGTSTKEKV